MFSLAPIPLWVVGSSVLTRPRFLHTLVSVLQFLRRLSSLVVTRVLTFRGILVRDMFLF